MACQIFRDNNGQITDVTAPNGKSSKLFKDINSIVTDKDQAVRLWAQVYTPSFKNWFGDWENGLGSKVVDDNGEPLLVFHGTGAEFAEFDKELRGSTTGKAADGSKSFDAENAFFFTNNENVAFNYAIMARQQELMLIASSLQTITSNLSWDQKRRQEVYKNLRKESPKFAAYVDGLKAQGLSSDQIMEKLKTLYQKYNGLEKEYARGGRISNPRRYYNDMEIEINKLQQNKQTILSGRYKSVSKYGEEFNTSYSLGYENVYLSSDGVIYGKIDAVPELAQFAGKNIISLSSKEFDTFVSGLRKILALGKAKVEEDIKKGGFTPRLMPVYLNIKTPSEKNFKGEPFVMQPDGRGALIEVSKLVKQAAADNNIDGVILKEIKDPELADNYAVFEPNQIKSIFNQGTFNQASDNIYYQLENEGVKPGVSELFESNPELANAVYEALGIYNVWHASDKKIDKFISENVEGYFAKVKKGSPKAVFFTANKAPQESFLSKREYQEQFAVKMNNPLVVDTKTGYSRDNESFKALVDRALAGNHDGVIVKNVDDNGFVGDVYISLNANQISKITPQQKQQAQQLYSQYLDTIFPDSKVKDIVYHGTTEKFDRFDLDKVNKNRKAFWFGVKPEETAFGVKIPALLNIPKWTDFRGKGAIDVLNNKTIDEIKEKGGNGFIGEGFYGETQIGVFEPEQIHILGSKQDIAGFKKFVGRQKNSNYLQQESKTSEQANKELDSKIKAFLEKLGVTVKSVEQIRDAQGQPLSAIAKADMLNKIIEVAEGRADLSTLPEEAAHFFVEMLGDNHPLIKQMMDKITGYEIYRQTVETYKDRPEYRNSDRSINFPKLKKEAIGKLIAKHILKQEFGNDSEQKVKELNTWWSKLWNLIKELFGKLDTNPFEQAAEQILNANTEDLDAANLSQGVFYQLDDSINKLKEDQSKLTLDNSIDDRTGQKRHVYEYNGKPVKFSVTTKLVDAFYKSVYPDDRRNEAQKQLDLLKAEYGDVIHETVQHIIDSYVDPATGYLRPTPVQSVSKHINSPFYSTLNSYVSQLISQYPAGTRFFREVKVYDPTKDMAGSIDFLIVQNDGTVDIYDWKSQEIKANQVDINKNKEKAYRIQLQAYMNILKKYYGFTKFGKVRAIPIKTNFSYSKQGDARSIERLNSIEMGPIDPRETPEDKDYLLPVTLIGEKSDNQRLSDYVVKLNKVLDRFQKYKPKAAEREEYNQRIDSYRKAIRDIHLRKDIRSFIALGQSEIMRYSELLSTNSLTPKDAMDALEILKTFTGTAGYFKEYMLEVKEAIKSTSEQGIKDLYQQILNDYNSMNSNAESVVIDIEEAIRNMGDLFAKEEAGIENILEPEKEVGRLAGMFNALSQITQKSFRLFSKMLNRAQNKRDNLYSEYLGDLKAAREGLLAWAQTKGISGERMFDGILDIDEKGEWTGNFLRKYKKEFFAARKNAIENSDLKWLMNNMYFDEDEYKDHLDRYSKAIRSIVYDIDPAVNEKRQNSIINSWIARHNAKMLIQGRANTAAWFNDKNRFLKINDNWVTDKWQDLQKPENAPLKQAYETFQKLIRKSEKLGMLDDYSPAFIPSIYKDKIDQVVFGGEVWGSSGFFEKLQVNEGDEYTPQTDPITGKVIHSIPVHFKRTLATQREDGSYDYSNKSRDLFKVFGVWAAQTANYEAMSEIEDMANMLIHVERGKDHLVTTNFDRVAMKGDQVETDAGNKRNADLLENFVNFYIYNKLGESDKDVTITVRGKEYSGMKALRMFMSFFSLKTLALNPISGTANFVGGKFNAAFQSSKRFFFNESDWASSMYQVTSRDAKTMALIHHGGVFLEDRKSATNEELSVSKIVSFNTMDKMYFIQRGSDKAVQYPVAVAIMMNHMVDENGKIVDITKAVKKEFNYDATYYNVSEAERSEMKRKMDERIQELKSTKSIYNTAQIVNDKLTVPGVDFKSNDWADFKAKIKQVNKSIMGNSTKDDINYIRTTMLGMSVMQFRSWMPQMVKERFGSLEYNQDLDMYTYGKANLFFRELFRHPAALASAIVNASGTNMIEAAKQSYVIERARAIENGSEFTLSEAEFIDLYIGNIRSMLRELAAIAGMLSLIFMVKPGDDEDKEERGYRAYASRALNKYFSELTFFYLSDSWTNMVNQPLPVVSLVTDFSRFVTSFIKEGYGVVVGDEEIQEKAKPMKYASRMLPILKEGILMRAIFDDDFRKDWDIRL